MTEEIRTKLEKQSQALLPSAPSTPKLKCRAAFQVRGRCKQIRSSDEDRARRAALHCPGQGEDLPRSGPGRSCSMRHWQQTALGFVLTSSGLFAAGYTAGFICWVPVPGERGI